MRTLHVMGPLVVLGLVAGIVPWSHAQPTVSKPLPKASSKTLPKAGAKVQPVTPPPKGKSDEQGFVWHWGTLESIFTEKNGDIINIAIDTGNGSVRDIQVIAGCGLNVQTLPHLMSGFGKDKRVQVQSVDGCIGRINVMMKL